MSKIVNKSAIIVLMTVIAFLYQHNHILAQGLASVPDSRSGAGPVAVEAYLSQNQASPGAEINLAVKLSIEPGWHVNSHTPSDEYLIPTDLSLADSAIFTLAEINYPAAKSVKFEFSPDAPLSVYDNVAWIKARLVVNKNAPIGKTTSPIQITTQACDSRSCVAPATQDLSIPIEIASNQTNNESRHKAIFESLGMTSGHASTISPPTAAAVELPPPPTEDQNFWSMLKNFKVESFVGRHGYILAFIAMYLLGLGLTLTPCVYPIIPITIGYFGSQASGKVSRQFMMAAVFGIGIAISYAFVGTLAAFSGSLMGAALQSPFVLVALAVLCFVMGLNSFGVFEIVLPGWLSNLAGGGGSRKGGAGAAIMGLTMGIAAAPCLAAFIVSLLAFVGQKGDPVLGFSMFFVLGLGLATPFIALGTFSGLLSKAPKSGAWMVYAKKVMGALLFGAALYFLNPVLPKPLYHSLVVVALVAAGLYFGFFEPTPARTWRFRAVRLLFAVLFIGSAIWWNLPEQGSSESVSGIAWQKYSEGVLEKAKSGSKPAIIDFYADWCIPCKELDKYAFSDPRVIEASRGIVMIKADLTSGSSPETQKLIQQYGIRGVPTVVFIKSDGAEEPSLRINQLEKAESVLARFNDLLALSKQFPPITASSGNL